VVPPSDENENYVVHLKQQSLLKTTLKTSLKSANKRQRNACLNYVPSNEQSSGLGAVQKHHIFAPAAIPQTLHGDRARRDHQKRWQKNPMQFFLQSAWKNSA